MCVGLRDRVGFSVPGVLESDRAAGDVGGLVDEGLDAFFTIGILDPIVAEMDLPDAGEGPRITFVIGRRR